MRHGIHYGVMKPSKRDRLRYALSFQYNRSGNNGVLHLIKSLNEPVVYSRDPEGFRGELPCKLHKASQAFAVLTLRRGLGDGGVVTD